MFRIQKLLQCEYKDLEEAVLVESPFARVNELGIGIKEVQLALTSTKLIIGNDTFNQSKTEALSNVFFDNQDPEIETMELLSMLPLEFLYIKVFRKGNRQLMRVSVGTNKVLWFEFGGHVLRNMYWNIWRERISALRASQSKVPYVETTNLFTVKSPLAVSTSSSEQVIPEPIQVIAEVHREDSQIKKKTESSSSILKVKDLLGSYKLFPKSSKPSPNTSRHSRGEYFTAANYDRCDQEMVLREVAEYFLETQSDIVIGQHTFGYDSCNVSCRDFLFRSASVANLMGGWSNNYYEF